VIQRPYVLVSCAMSVDGYIDDASGTRLVLSGEADLDRVDEVRAGCDAIMVGANTIRRDNPRLRIRSAQRRAGRAAAGQPEHPVRVTLTGTGDLDPAAEFFTATGPRPLVFCARPALAAARARLSDHPTPIDAELIDAGDPPSLALLLHKLSVRGISKLLLEGGGQLATEFLTAGLADELHLVVAPFFVGDPAAPRFALPGYYPHTPAAPMRLAETRAIDDVVLLRYDLTPSLATTPPLRPRARHAAPSQQPSSSAPGPASSTPAPEPHLGAPTAIPPPPFPADPTGLTPEPHLNLPAPEPSAAATPPSNLSLPPQLPRRPQGGSRSEDIHWLRETIARLDKSGSAQSRGPAQPGPSPSPDLAPSPAHPDPGPFPGQFPGLGPDPAAGTELPPSFEPEWPPPGSAYPHPAIPAGQGGATPTGEDGTGAAGARPADVDVSWLREAVELSKRAPPSQTAFSVGAIIVAADGTPLATGFSRETDLRDHAEEAALAKLPPRDPRLAMATLYSSLEPCGVRASRPRPCADLIIAAGLRRVVYAWHEPPLLAPGGGAEKLRAAGVAVIEVPELADQARRINAHLTDRHP
jgi:5-amino-6-(5-phosphoribosylamino)uracil reductase